MKLIQKALKAVCQEYIAWNERAYVRKKKSSPRDTHPRLCNDSESGDTLADLCI